MKLQQLYLRQGSQTQIHRGAIFLEGSLRGRQFRVKWSL
jgi:hypothetical protein